MQERHNRVRAAITAATRYHLDNYSMAAIATELGVSRSTVSRLLSYAKTEGLVTVTVQPLTNAPSSIETQLANRFDITATVVPVPPRITEAERLEHVASAAARHLGHTFGSHQSLGIAWGATISAISTRLTPTPTRGARIVQLNGAANPHTTGILYADELLRRFGDAFSADVLQFPVPAFFDNPATRDALWRERSIARIVAAQRAVDIALFSVGTPKAAIASHVYSGGYLDAADIASLSQQGVIGDVTTVFFRKDGTWADIPLNARASGPGIDVLSSIPHRICVIAGAGKVPSLRGLLAGRVISHLIIDEDSARTLLAADRH